MNNVVEVYCAVDDFMKIFLPEWQTSLLTSGEKKRMKQSRLSVSEVVTLLVLFHQSNYRTLKHFYLFYAHKHLLTEFPHLVSYSQFVRLQQTVLVPLCAYLNSNKGEITGISYVDSTPIKVCHNRRIHRHKVFSNVATRGKSSMGWFFGFKLHLVVNDRGELLAFSLTPGNTDDRKPLAKLTKNLTGKLFGDRGYLSKKWFDTLLEQGLQLITTVRKNMKNRLLPLRDKILLRKRFIIETINDQLKNISQIEHSRHRSITNFMVNLVAGLAAYCLQPKKPSLKLYPYENNSLVICN